MRETDVNDKKWQLPFDASLQRGLQTADPTWHPLCQHVLQDSQTLVPFPNMLHTRLDMQIPGCVKTLAQTGKLQWTYLGATDLGPRFNHYVPLMVLAKKLRLFQTHTDEAAILAGLCYRRTNPTQTPLLRICVDLLFLVLGHTSRCARVGEGWCFDWSFHTCIFPCRRGGQFTRHVYVRQSMHIISQTTATPYRAPQGTNSTVVPGMPLEEDSLVWAGQCMLPSWGQTIQTQRDFEPHAWTTVYAAHAR
jgi:hypothetical protein